MAQTSCLLLQFVINKVIDDECFQRIFVMCCFYLQIEGCNSSNGINLLDTMAPLTFHERRSKSGMCDLCELWRG